MAIYRVGHAALILVDKDTGTCSYYDFGRYGTPDGYGRVRNPSDDHDLKDSNHGHYRGQPHP